MSYSYCSSELNPTSTMARLPQLLPYSVTLSTKAKIISHLPTRVPFRTASTQTRVNTLSHFRGLFNDHRRPIRSNTGEPICRTYFFNNVKEHFLYCR
jgi:hypothetical protein